MRKRPRLLIVGVDCADYHFYAQWMAEGTLPWLARLAECGSFLRCRSTLPAATAPAWTTAITGCNPGRHGLYDFLELPRPRTRMFWTMPRGGSTLFRRASDAGLASGALNVPLTFPAELIEGVMVSGLGAPELPAAAFHPRKLRDELFAAVPDYVLQPRVEPGLPPSEADLIRCVEARGRAALHLLDAHELELFMVVFGALDWAVHGYAGEEADWGTVRRVAQAIDRQLGALAERVGWPEASILVISDHGMRRATRQVNLHKLFVELGLLALAPEGNHQPRGSGLTPRLIDAWNLAKRVLPPRLIGWLRRRGHYQRIALLDSLPPLAVDWTRSIAAPVGYFGCVRLSVEGRDPDGIVPAQDYQAVRSDVIQRLRGVTDPVSGQPLFAQVLAREEAYDGPLLDGAPDIVLVPGTEDLAFGGASRSRELIAFMRQPGVVQPLVPHCGLHSANGVFLLSGAAAKAGDFPEGCTLEDVAPTVLHLLGLPVPSYVDGQARIECLTGPAAERPVDVADEPLPLSDPQDVDVTEDDREIVEQRLRDLGYL